MRGGPRGLGANEGLSYLPVAFPEFSTLQHPREVSSGTILSQCGSRGGRSYFGSSMFSCSLHLDSSSFPFSVELPSSVPNREVRARRAWDMASSKTSCSAETNGFWLGRTYEDPG